MRLFKMFPSIGLVAVFTGVIPARAHRPGCDSPLSKVASLFPWPQPTEEMIHELRRIGGRDESGAGLRRALEAALENPSPNAAVRAIFIPAGLTGVSPASLKDIRTAYAPGGASPGPGHALQRDPWGLRTALAAALVAIAEPALRREWMDFLARDQVMEVRLAAARTFVAWDDPAERDAYLLDPGLDEPTRRLRMLSARRDLDRVSPAARWQIIKLIAPYHVTRDADVLAAIGTFDEAPLLKAWYADLIRGRYITDALKDFERRENSGLPRAKKGVLAPEGPLDEGLRRHRAHNLGYRLYQIGNDSDRAEALTELRRLSLSPAPVSVLARESLAWEAVWEILLRNAFAREDGAEIPDAAEDKELAAVVPDEESFRIAVQTRDGLKQLRAPRRERWSGEDLKRFEARVRGLGAG